MYRTRAVVSLIVFVVSMGSSVACLADPAQEMAAMGVLQRTLGETVSERFRLHVTSSVSGSEARQEPDKYQLETKDNLVHVEANSAIGLTRGSYDYLKVRHNNIQSWSGSRIQLPGQVRDFSATKQSPYLYRYYFNVVTHGYSTAYWDWNRWEQEIDWMALHGINMPLIGGAHEAILYRVFRKLGLTEEESYAYFSGPAHFPWNRMGNLIGWDGADRLPRSYFDEQVALNHRVLKRMRSLGMYPIIHAFAGFVPPAIKRVFPDAEIRELGWGGGLPNENNAYILSPESELFTRIGKLYIEEWEKEFGRNTFYLADSFNEMDVPQQGSEDELLRELGTYGESVYKSIAAADPEAIWVMQGWTFPYHKDSNGELFWTPERLHALVSKVPDEKLLILDLANEYNHVFWKIAPSWKMYDGFFNKQWIYSFIPNMGGKTPLNGRLDVYASIPVDALEFPGRGNQVGFGFAPEGVENNEMIYELIADMGWEQQALDLTEWQETYAMQRYGAYPDALRESYRLLNQSALGSFTDHPIYRFQLRPYRDPEGVEPHATVHDSAQFREAVGEFLQASEELGDSLLYRYDAVELTVLFLGLVVDDMLREFLAAELPNRDYDLFNEAMDILLAMDELLQSHPNHQLERWVDHANSWGSSEAEKAYYESNAKRLLTTWGGDPVNDYAGRVWAGLIGDYYVPRWRAYHQAVKKGEPIDVKQWEEQWINQDYRPVVRELSDPLLKAERLHRKYAN